ncbi:hypothetical protein FQA39_LY19120 [Lamprigera yunnana]|nr:hypothetical protein FQA39_LY19120 [Lamprigera yunnana]
MDLNIKDIKNTNEIDSLLNKSYSGVLHSGFIEIGKDNFCFLGYYKNYKEKINKFEVRDSDVYLVAHPKTGTTWAQEMIWLIVNDLNYETAQENILKRFPSIEYGAHYENETGLYDIDYMTYLNEMPSPRCIRSHLHWSLLPEQIKNGIKKPKIISVIRKVEDVCVSYYYHCKLLEGYIGTFEEFCKLFLAGRTIYGPFWKSVLSVWEQRHRFNILFLKYSDMKKDLVGVIKTVANYLERDLSEDAIQELSKHLSFDSMKNNSNVNFVPGWEFVSEVWSLQSALSYKLSYSYGSNFKHFYEDVIRAVAEMSEDAKINIYNILDRLSKKSDDVCCMLEVLFFMSEKVLFDVQLERRIQKQEIQFIKKMWMMYAEQHWTKAIDLKLAVERLYKNLGALEFDADHEAIYVMDLTPFNNVNNYEINTKLEGNYAENS